ncbi:MAG: PEGA domain-containing protein [Polyangiaceae bacterium]|nr:PEGA domain-containing protein [Polyangiaceae bacterium]
MRRQTFRGAISTIAVSALLATTVAAQPAPGEPVAPVAPPAPAAVDGAEVPPLADALSGAAKAEYEAGKLLYGDGDFAGATLKFQRAYDLSKDGRLLWNVAVCEKNLRHYARVLRVVRRYQTEAGPTLSEADKREATDLVNAVSAFVSPVWVTVNEAGATISVDGEVVARSPFAEPVLVDMGTRRIKVSKRGFRDHTQNVPVAGATELRLSVNLQRAAVDGRLLIVAGPGETIFLDGRVVGEGRWDGKVRPGRHDIRVIGEGKQVHESEVVVREKETRELRLSLRAMTREKESGGSSGWLWLTGGTALLAGAVVGGYFLFRPEDKDAPPSVPGTMAPGTVQLPLRGAWR